MKILNVVIPILMHFCSFVSNLSKAACHPTKCDIIKGQTISDSISQDILLQFFMLSNETSRYKSKCIKILIYSKGPVYKMKLFACWVIFPCSFVVCWFFSHFLFLAGISSEYQTVWISSEYQTVWISSECQTVWIQTVGPDLGPSFLQRLSADDNRRQS